jgi:ATP-dependent RNA helicase SUPV3L1/SUV3
MLSFLKKSTESTVTDNANPKTPGSPKPAKASTAHPLDALTGGAFSAPTSGDRAAKVREWLATNPSADQMQEVFKELSSKDKGAAKPLREKLDEIKRAGASEHLAVEWADKANALLAHSKLNIADALAWQRDAAKAGAPLSKEPLLSVKGKLSERVKLIEDLQHRAQVQREAALLMAQRIEVLSTKPLADAQAAWDVLRADVTQWQTQADAMATDAQWPSVDAKFTPQLDTAKSQLLSLWNAFEAALAQAVAALGDKAAPLPAVPVWAEAIRVARGDAEPKPEKPVKPKIDPEVRSQATQIVRDLLAKLEHELSEGHGKASVGAANAVRAALKEHGAHIGDRLDAAAQHALGAAGELEGWQRWRANQIREELTHHAQALVAKPLGGRKQQDAVRNLRDAWKQTDQGGVPNHGMWKRFDDACNEAYKLVEAWLEKVKAEEGAHKAQRLVMIEEIKAWGAANATRTDWKEVNRELHHLSEQWRNGGHVGEKTFAELQPLYKAAIKEAHAPLEAAQTASLARRHAMIEEAKVLSAAPMMRIDAVKSLQQRWQHEAQAVPIERKQEQKLWDAFRSPIDDAFNRKSAEREQAAAAMSVHDKAVLDAVKAVDAANASGDASKIRAAIAGLEAAARGQAAAAVAPSAAAVSTTAAPAGNATTSGADASSAATDVAADASAAPDAAQPEPAPADADKNTANPAAESAEPAQAAIKSVVPEAAPPAVTDAALAAQASPESAEKAESTSAEPSAQSDAPAQDAGQETAQEVSQEVAPAAPAALVKLAKPVIAMRGGDDRPGAKKTEPAGGRFGDKKGGGKFGDRSGPGAGRGGQDGRGGSDSRGAVAGRDGGRDGGRDSARFDSRGDRNAAPGTGQGFDHNGPRLSNTAFYAQRDALERAQLALKKLAAQAHGESLTALMTAWEHRQADSLPTAQQLGRDVSPAARTAWAQAVAKPASGDAATALLRLEMAADVPTPAEHISARRMLQLQLLTKRNDAAPVDTWALDTTAVLSTPFDAANARRLQAALKTFLR